MLYQWFPILWKLSTGSWFNIDIHDTISIPDGIMCACFIAFLYKNSKEDVQETKEGKIIRKIKKCIKKEDATFEKEFNYDEKNIVITELDKFFNSIDYEYFGIEEIFLKYEMILMIFCCTHRSVSYPAMIKEASSCSRWEQKTHN